MTSSSFSRPSTAPSVPSSASRQSRKSSARQSAGHNDHQDRATGNQLGPSADVSRRLSRHSSTAPSSRNRYTSRNPQSTPSYSPATAFDVLMPLVSALISVLQPSEELLGAVDVLRQQIADAIRALKPAFTEVNARPLVRWWCPCCHHYHDGTECNALARVSPCKHCGSGHSERSCPIRRAQVQQARAGVQPVEARPPGVPQPSATDNVFGDMSFPVSTPQVQPERAQVERTANLGTDDPSSLTAATQSPAADPVAQTPVITLARGGDVTSPGVEPESAAAAIKDFNSSSVPVVGERKGEQKKRRSFVQASTQTDSTSLTALVTSKHAKDPTTADTPVASSVGIQGDLENVIPAAAQRRTRRQPGSPVLPVKLFTLHKSHQGCCSMRECGQPLLGPSCYVATLDPRSFNPFKGYCLCAECRNSSDEYQRLFPHPVLLHEPPDVLPKVDSVSSAYLTGTKYVGLCAKPECGQPLTTDESDQVFVVDTDPRSQNPWRNVTICKTCRNSSDKNKHLFSRGIMVSSQHVHDYRENYRVRTSPHQALREWDLPDNWAPPHPNSLRAAQQKCDAQFAWNFGCRVLNASLSGKSVLTVQQAQEHFRTKLLAFCERHQQPHNTVEAYLSYLSNTRMQAALPTLLSTGFTTVLFEATAYAGNLPTHTYHCAECRGAVSMTDAVTCASESELRYYLLRQHARHSPRCNFFEQLKRDSILPELFFPDTRQRSSVRKVQAALHECVAKRTKFLKSFQGNLEFTVIPPSGDPTVQVLNPWTNTEFDQEYWNSIVPSCTYVIA